MADPCLSGKLATETITCRTARVIVSPTVGSYKGFNSCIGLIRKARGCKCRATAISMRYRTAEILIRLYNSQYKSGRGVQRNRRVEEQTHWSNAGCDNSSIPVW